MVLRRQAARCRGSTQAVVGLRTDDDDHRACDDDIWGHDNHDRARDDVHYCRRRDLDDDFAAGNDVNDKAHDNDDTARPGLDLVDDAAQPGFDDLDDIASKHELVDVDLAEPTAPIHG